MEGKQIAELRAARGMSQRELGSRLGLTLRKVKAMEADMDPKPRLEKRTYAMKFIDFAGYYIRVRSDWPVRDLSFDLKHEQTRAVKLLTGIPAITMPTRKSIAKERSRLVRAHRKNRRDF